MSTPEPSPTSTLVEIDPTGRISLHFPQSAVAFDDLGTGDGTGDGTGVNATLPAINVYCPNNVKGCGSKLTDEEAQVADAAQE